MMILTLLAFSAFTLQASPKRAKGNFTRADSNKDEKVSKEEFTKFYTQKKVSEEKQTALWEVSDADKDEHLTLEEWTKGRENAHKGKEKKDKKDKKEKKNKKDKKKKEIEEA